MVYDLSQSYSEPINAIHRDTGVMLGVKFCSEHANSGDILLNAITPASEPDSRLTRVACPECKNETQCKSELLVFEPRLRAATDEVTALLAADAGSDVLGALHYAGRVAFERLEPAVRYLVVFSDMQHTGDDVRNCIRNQDSDPETCLALYYDANPDNDRKSAHLRDVATYVIGFGRNITGPLTAVERQHYKTFWATFFEEQRARVCWFGADFPLGSLPDGTRGVSDDDFRFDCPEAQL